MTKYLFFTACCCLYCTTCLLGQQFLIGGGIGLGSAHGPIEKYSGTNIKVVVGRTFGPFVVTAHYKHFNGDIDYGTLYSKDTPNVGVIDKYGDNYPLKEFINRDFSETRVGIHQFDPSFSFYISRQVGLNVGYTWEAKIGQMKLLFRPMVGVTYTRVAENFIYGVREITVEDGISSENYIKLNHLIFAYLKYSDFGYGVQLPVSVQLKPSLELFVEYSIHRSIKTWLSSHIGIGILTKI